MGRLGTWELIVIVLGLLLLFGARRIPEIARSLGQALNQFKRGMKDASLDEDDDDSDRIEGPGGEGTDSGRRPEEHGEGRTTGDRRGEGEDR
jgi:sec-independent protein translocase protein TatA